MAAAALVVAALAPIWATTSGLFCTLLLAVTALFASCYRLLWRAIHLQHQGPKTAASGAVVTDLRMQGLQLDGRSDTAGAGVRQEIGPSPGDVGPGPGRSRRESCNQPKQTASRTTAFHGLSPWTTLLTHHSDVCASCLAHQKTTETDAGTVAVAVPVGPDADQAEVLGLLTEHGAANSYAYTVFSNPEMEVLLVRGVGWLPYTVARAWGRTVVAAVGDPVCAPQHTARVLSAFRDAFPDGIFVDIGKAAASTLVAADPQLCVTDVGPETVIDVAAFHFERNKV